MLVRYFHELDLKTVMMNSIADLVLFRLQRQDHIQRRFPTNSMCRLRGFLRPTLVLNVFGIFGRRSVHLEHGRTFAKNSSCAATRDTFMSSLATTREMLHSEEPSAMASTLTFSRHRA